MEQWLTYAKAAELLGVEARTIKRWMTRPAVRDALGAVTHGRQWRIPYPDDDRTWEIHTRHRLEIAGVPLKPSWERDLENAAKENDRYSLESYRLWLAAYGKALERGRITPKARLGILLLWQAACKTLSSFKQRGIELDKLKADIPRDLLRYWPNEKHLKIVRTAHTLKELETIRCRYDLLQATRDLKRRGKKPTAENLRPLLHKNIEAHINDTREKLEPCVVDKRQPQTGLKLRTFRTRYPLKQSPQKDIVDGVLRIRSSLPSFDERPDSGKTPIRGSSFEKNSD